MKLGKLAKIFAILATACLMVPSLFADNFEITRQPNAYTKPELPAQSPDRASYVGRLRVHMVEIESRWNDNAGTPFDYALLDFVIDQPFGVADGGLYSDVAIWNSQAHAFANLAEDNYAVTAVVFNGTPVTQDAFPPYGYWFNAYYADATAQATPNVIGENSIDGGYSHTVFVEEGTANW